MTSAINSSYINGLWGLNTPAASITDQSLASLLVNYLGTLPTYQTDVNGNITSAPFTKNMSLEVSNDIQSFLTDLQNSSNWGNLGTDLNQILSDAQTYQTTGIPSWSGYSAQPSQSTTFLGSGGLARNTASALGGLLAALQQAGILTLSGNAYTVDTTNLSDWLSASTNIALVQAAQAQLLQDAPIVTSTILVNGVETTIQIPLNQSLQEVLQTQYVEHGASIVYSGLQAIVNQQQGAEDAIQTLNQLQQVYNGIKTIPASTLITGWNATNVSSTAFKHDLANFLYTAAQEGGGQLSFYESMNTLQFTLYSADYASATDLENHISVEVHPYYNNIINITLSSPDGSSSSLYQLSLSYLPLTGASSPVTTLANGFIGNNAEYNPIKSLYGDISSSFLLDFIGKSYGPGTANSIFSPDPPLTAQNFLSTMLDPTNAEDYQKDLAAVLAAIYPEPGTVFDSSGIQVFGSALSTAPGGNMQQLINQIYQTYLNQAAQRLLDAANANGSVLVIDPSMTTDSATGQVGYIVNPALTGDAKLAAADSLQVIRTVLAYAHGLNVSGAPSSINLTDAGVIDFTTGATQKFIPITSTPVSGPNGTLTDEITVGGQTVSGLGTFGFGSPQGGSLEDNLRTILGNLVGGSGIKGGSSSVVGAITFGSDYSLNITKWIQGIWPTGLGDMPTNTNIALDQTQSYLSNAFSSASAVNSQLQQQLQQAFFLFQEFMQSATDTLSAINQLIVKKAQAISG